MLLLPVIELSKSTSAPEINSIISDQLCTTRSSFATLLQQENINLYSLVLQLFKSGQIYSPQLTAEIETARPETNSFFQSKFQQQE